MKGGSIGNSGGDNAVEYRGVVVTESGTFIMEDGSISCNGRGECVYMHNGTFTMAVQLNNVPFRITLSTFSLN